MRGRQPDFAAPAKTSVETRHRNRISIELTDAEAARLDATLANHPNTSRAAWGRAAIEASLAGRGYVKAFERMLSNEHAKQRQQFLDAALWVLSNMVHEPFLLPPERPLEEHLAALVASRSLREIRDGVLALVRHVAAMESKSPKSGTNTSGVQEQRQVA